MVEYTFVLYSVLLKSIHSSCCQLLHFCIKNGGNLGCHRCFLGCNRTDYFLKSIIFSVVEKILAEEHLIQANGASAVKKDVCIISRD